VHRSTLCVGRFTDNTALGQTLVATAGFGRVQRSGGPIEEIRPGVYRPDIVDKAATLYKKPGYTM